MAQELKELCQLLFPDSTTENAEYFSDITEYIKKLGSQNWEHVKKEPERLDEDMKHLTEQTQDLAFTNYKTFVETADISRAIMKDLGKSKESLASFLNNIPDFESQCESFSQVAGGIVQEKRRYSTIRNQSDKLLELLELPSLMREALNAEDYESALDIFAFIRNLSKRYSEIPIVEIASDSQAALSALSSVVFNSRVVENCSQLLNTLANGNKSTTSEIMTLWYETLYHLFNQLHYDLPLPQCLQILGYLRRANTVFKSTEDEHSRLQSISNKSSFTSDGLHLHFLKARNAWFEKALEDARNTEVCHRGSRRALVSCVAVLCAAAGSGAGAVNSFAAAVLQHSAHRIPILNATAYNFTIYNGTLPRNLFEASEAGSMLCGTALVLGAAVATITVDKIGRKTLLLCSCSGIAIALTILGIYCDPHLRLQSWYIHRLWPVKKYNYKDKNIRERLNLQDNYTAYDNAILHINDSGKPWYRVSVEHNITEDADWSVKFEDSKEKDEIKIWLPVLVLSLVLFLYNIGLGSVPYVLITELFSVNVRSLASGFLITWMWFSNFLLLRYFGSIAISLGLHATYYICACITLLGALYIYFVLPETKGKCQAQIEDALKGPWLLLKGNRKNER